MPITGYRQKFRPVATLLVCLLAPMAPATADVTAKSPIAAAAGKQVAGAGRGFVLSQAFTLGGELRGISLPAMSFEPKVLAEALDLALDGTPYVFALRSPLTGPFPAGVARVAGGDAPAVFDQLGRVLDFFWAVDGGIIAADGTREFVLSIPTAQRSESPKIRDSLVSMGASNVRLAPELDIVAFQASPRILEVAKKMLASIGQKKSLPPLQVSFGPQAAPAVLPTAVPTSIQSASPAAEAAKSSTAVSQSPAAPVAVPNPNSPPSSDQATPAASTTPAVQPASPSAAVTPSQIAAIAQERIKLMEAKRAAPASFWAIRRTDKSVEGLLKRWAQHSGWQVRYEFERIPVLSNSSVVATDFIDAVKQIQIQLVEAGYDVDLTSIGKTLRLSTGGKL